jgi:two-component system LytT family response regulator
MKLRSVIIDDEFTNRELLKIQIEASCKNLEVCGMAGNIHDGVIAINKLNPDVVFLDVEMPGEDGFALFQYFSKPHFLIIFITAFHHYSIKAIQNKAFDYLLKPVEERELIKVEQRIIGEFSADRNVREQQNLDRIGKLLKEIEFKRQLEEKKIYVPTLGGFRLIKINSVQFLEAKGNYTSFKFKNGNTLLVTRTLGDFEIELSGHSFYRCHKSYLINLELLESYNQSEGSKCTTIYGESIPVSRRKYAEFMEAVINHVGNNQISKHDR